MSDAWINVEHSFPRIGIIHGNVVADEKLKYSLYCGDITSHDFCFSDILI